MTSLIVVLYVPDNPPRVNGLVTLSWWGAELEIVVELGNLVPRNNLASQKLFVALRD